MGRKFVGGMRCENVFCDYPLVPFSADRGVEDKVVTPAVLDNGDV